MKKKLRNTVVFSVVLLLCSCNSKKEDNEILNDSTKSVTVNDSIKAKPKAEISKSIEGKVEEIVNGKDGYTAKVSTASSEVYFVTVSHSNLTYHEQYKTFKLGEEIKVTGVFWQIENTNQITVRTID
jgi:hypothetical protein